MRASQTVVVASLGFLVQLGGAPALAADAARGNTLYHTFYRCTDCHATAPGFGFPIAKTANDVLSAIQSVPQMRIFLTTLGENQTDLDDIAAYLANPSGSTTPDLNQHGLTGSWYEPATSGQGIEVEFFPDLVAPGTSFVQGAWFTFSGAPAGGNDHSRWYTFAGNGVSGNSSVSITIYQNVGGNFNAAPPTSATAVGSGTLAFTDCTHGSLTYTFSDGSGRSGSITLTRLLANVTCVVAGTRATNGDFGLSGNWYEASTSGQGFVFEVNPVSPFFFLTWYTYAPAGQSAGAAGQRWFTGQTSYAPGSRSIVAPLYETTGGVFDQVTNPEPSTVQVGTATVTFASCSSAQVQFTFTAGSSAGKSAVIAVQRVGPVPAGCGP